MPTCSPPLKPLYTTIGHPPETYPWRHFENLDRSFLARQEGSSFDARYNSACVRPCNPDVVPNTRPPTCPAGAPESGRNQKPPRNWYLPGICAKLGWHASPSRLGSAHVPLTPRCLTILPSVLVVCAYACARVREQVVPVLGGLESAAALLAGHAPGVAVGVAAVLW